MQRQKLQGVQPQELHEETFLRNFYKKFPQESAAARRGSLEVAARARFKTGELVRKWDGQKHAVVGGLFAFIATLAARILSDTTHQNKTAANSAVLSCSGR